MAKSSATAMDTYKSILGKQMAIHECPDCGRVMLGIYVETGQDARMLTQCINCGAIRYKVFSGVADKEPDSTKARTRIGVIGNGEPITRDFMGQRVFTHPSDGTACPPTNLTLGPH